MRRQKFIFMARESKILFQEALALPEGDRAALAGLLLESLEFPPDASVEESWSLEAERRWKAIESRAVQTIPWKDVRAKLFSSG